MRVVVPGTLREWTGGRTEIELDGETATVAQALDTLFARYPGLRDRITDEQGRVREHIHVYAGEENICFLDGLSTALAPGAVVSIMRAVSGG